MFVVVLLIFLFISFISVNARSDYFCLANTKIEFVNNTVLEHRILFGQSCERI
jgi:hypothetical protein